MLAMFYGWSLNKKEKNRRNREQYCWAGAGRSQCEGPAPDLGSILDKTEEILNYNFFVRSNIYLRIIKKQILNNK